MKILSIEKFSCNNTWDLEKIVEKKTLLARAVINNPDLLLLNKHRLYLEDKDTEEITNFIISKIKEIIKKETALVITSDDLVLAKLFAQKILYLKHGKIESWCTDKDYF